MQQLCQEICQEMLARKLNSERFKDKGKLLVCGQKSNSYTQYAYIAMSLEFCIKNVS